MKQFIKGLETIFSDLKDSNGKNANEIAKNIQELESYANNNQIDTDFSLTLILKKEIRENIQKILSMRSNDIKLHLQSQTFNTDVYRLHSELKGIINDTKRFKVLILEHAMHLKSLRNKNEINRLNEQLKERDIIIKELIRGVNQRQNIDKDIKD